MVEEVVVEEVDEVEEEGEGEVVVALMLDLLQPSRVSLLHSRQPCLAPATTIHRATHMRRPASSTSTLVLKVPVGEVLPRMPAPVNFDIKTHTVRILACYPRCSASPTLLYTIQHMRILLHLH